MALNLAGNYALGRNIDLGPALASASGMWGSAGFVPIGYAFGDPSPFSVTAFTGTFDGNGHSISNLVINRSTTTAAGDYTGLFGYTTGTIKNVTLINPNVSGHFAVGSLAGFSSGTVQNVTVTGGFVDSDRYYIGGLIGWNKGSVTNAWYSGTVTGGDVTGGLVGFNDAGTVTSSHASATVSGANYLGGLVGYNGGAISSSDATGAVTGSATSDYVGGLVGWNNAGTIMNSYATGAVSGRNYIGGLLGYGISGSVINSYATGNVNGVIWVGGLIGWTDGSVSDSHADGDVSGVQYVGGLIGELGHAYVSGGVGSGSVTNSYATGTVSASQNYAGGLIGQSWGSVTNSYATGDVSGGDRVGGLIGVNEIFSYTANSYATGDVTGTGAAGNQWIGGLAGVNAGTVTLSYATGNVYAPNSYYVGGLVGYNWCCRLGSYTEISLSYATGNVTGFQSVGGLVGQNESTGSNASTVVTQSYATGNVTGPQDVGGLVGQNNNATITQSYATGAVSASTYNPGGLVGYNAPGGTISYSYATGAVSLIGGAQWAGGFVGWNNGTITQSYSTGLVSGPAGQFVGGFAGNSGFGTITLSYWDTQTSGHSNGLGTGPAMPGLIGQTTAQLKNGALPNGFDPAYWGLFSSNSYPCLLWQASCLRVITYSVGDSSSTYGTLATLGTITLAGVLAGDAANVIAVTTIFDSLNSAVSLTDALNAGTYTVAVTGLSGSAAGNYIISSTGNHNGILTINPAPLIVAVNDASRLYGDANPAFSATVTGLVLGQDASVLGLSFSTLATIFSDVGNYAITLTGMTNPNYYIQSSTNGMLTINPAPLVVAVNDASRLYGDANPAFSATVTGLVLGQDASVLGLSFSTLATIFSNVGNYAITVSGITNNNYYIQSSTNGTLTIDPAPLVVAVNDASRLYGDANPAFSAAVTGLVLGQDASVLGLNFSTLATIFSNVGNYAITVTGLANQNYYIQSSTNGTLTINPAPLVVAVNDASRLYGDANPAFSATVTGLVLGQDASVLGLSFATLATIFSDVGNYAITLSGMTNSNYYIQSSTNGMLTINPAPLVVAVNDASRLYGDANPAFSATVTGLVLGQDASVLGLSFATLATIFSDVGNYAITLTGMTNSNYYIQSSTNGTLTINPAPLVVAVNDASRLYGDANPAFSATVTGLVLGQDASVLGLSFATLATIFSDVGDYAITVSGITNSNYYIQSSTNGTLTINPAPLYVAVNDASRLFYDANPEFSATITGFVLGQDASVLSGLTLSTSATLTSLPGTYAIIALGGTAKNYVIVSRLDGTLTILPRISEGAPQVMATLRCAGAAGRDQDDGKASCDFDPRFDDWPAHRDLRGLPASTNDDIGCAVAGGLVDCRGAGHGALVGARR
jgi:AraC-like DNA-binding protein